MKKRNLFMKLSILFCTLVVFTIINISGVYSQGGTDTATSTFMMPGCGDVLVGLCSSDIPKYCNPADTQLISKCTSCGCPPASDPNALWCNNEGCEVPVNVNCEDYPEQLGGCDEYLGVCWWDYEVPGNECTSCPDRTTSEADCSLYQDQESCEEDKCFFGKTGIGSEIITSKYVIADRSCDWVAEADDKCQYSFNTINPTTGEKSRCSVIQIVTPCENDASVIKWSNICKNKDDAITEEDSGQTVRPCGKAASPLPFFNASSLILALSFISVYYFNNISKNRQKKKKK